MKVSIVGTGYVGLVTGTCFAELGHDVLCHDIDELKIDGLKNGVMPIYEPGLDELLKRNLKVGRLRFTTDIAEAVNFAEILMSAVGTPPGDDHEADLRYVSQVAQAFAEHLKPGEYKLFVNKSTVPAGTAELCQKLINDVLIERKVDADFDVVSNPEFLREGSAVTDTLNPDRIVVGLESDRAQAMMTTLYMPIVSTGKILMVTDVRSAELIKYAANAFLATKISFINEMAGLCEKVGADVKEVSKGIGLDNRIGPEFLHAGLGYGGSCLPKDVKALINTFESEHEEFYILKAVDAVNDKQRKVLFEKLNRYFDDLTGLTIAVLGLSFKPKTDDLRFAPSIDLINDLLEAGAKVRIFDPVAMSNFKKQYVDLINHDLFFLAEDSFDAAKDADCLMILTEWDEFIDIDLKKLQSLMRGNLILDGRNIYEPKYLAEMGFIYEGIGRRGPSILRQSQQLSETGEYVNGYEPSIERLV